MICTKNKRNIISEEQHRFNLEDIVEREIFSQIQNRKTKLY